jgi:uncharacterized protein (TIGR03382 family)
VNASYSINDPAANEAAYKEYSDAVQAAPHETNAYELVLTRLHARYGKAITNDLVFKTADPIVGGREHVDLDGKIEHTVEKSDYNNFQARYAIRHKWTGPIACVAPKRNVWGGPPEGTESSDIQPALGLAFAERGSVKLRDEVMRDIPELGVKVHTAGCGCQASAPIGLVVPFGLVAAFGFLRPRRRRTRQ